jgi:hypothetical protein
LMPRSQSLFGARFSFPRTSKHSVHPMAQWNPLSALHRHDSCLSDNASFSFFRHKKLLTPG